MNTDSYKKLAQHLDDLSTGYPPTENGVELRILEKLFTPAQAELAVHLKTRPEPASKIALRAGLKEPDAYEKLDEMARSGLIFSMQPPDSPLLFMAAPFVVGIWEYHVNDLDRELIVMVNEYMPTLTRDAFDVLPQLRTIPLDKSIDASVTAMDYERAEMLVREQKKFLVAPCICRKEHKLTGAGCDKLLDACLIFGWAADYYERNGIGRVINLEETLEILKKADEDGLVLQPSNAESIVNICCCCGDCCQVLLSLKRHPKPGLVAASAFIARLAPSRCVGCESCVDRCQMDALHMDGAVAVLDPDRCIGCGLCVTTCDGEALTLVRKPDSGQPVLPENMMKAMSMRSKTRAQAAMQDKLKRLKNL